MYAYIIHCAPHYCRKNLGKNIVQAPTQFIGRIPATWFPQHKSIPPPSSVEIPIKTYIFYNLDRYTIWIIIIQNTITEVSNYGEGEHVFQSRLPHHATQILSRVHIVLTSFATPVFLAWSPGSKFPYWIVQVLRKFSLRDLEGNLERILNPG